MKIVVTDDAGKRVEVHPLVLAMMRVLMQGHDAITRQREAVVELHYVSQTCKVSGKLKHHIGLERTNGPPEVRP